MFETVELGSKIDPETFEREEEALRTELLRAQFALQKTNTPVIIVIAGVEGAGKGEVANRLSEWLDVRGLETHAFRIITDEEQLRPRMWRYWRSLPARGQIGIYIRSWYTQPIIEHALGAIDDAAMAEQLTRVGRFEEMLARDRALFVKLWLHIPKKTQGKRFEKLRKKAATRWRVTEADLERHRHYSAFSASAERAIRHTDVGTARWHLVEATQRRHRDITVGRIILQSMQDALLRNGSPEAPIEDAEPSALPSGAASPATNGEHHRTVLDTVRLDSEIDTETYKDEIEELQEEMGLLAWQAEAHGRSVVVVFEGWDAAGKGGCIRRLTQALDARLYKVRSISAPTEEERAHHYLWRFWRHIPTAGRFTVYDRSWYGRVLVERVEGFARPDEWQRAFHEINDFEEQLVEAGVSVVKFFLHIDPEEQLRRFEERASVAYKRHKLTEEDWRNRAKWSEYERAIDDMVRRTSTAIAPWILVPSNDKRFSRLQVLRSVRDRLRADLGKANGKKKNGV